MPTSEEGEDDQLVEMDIMLSAHANARVMYENKKLARTKELKTLQVTCMRDGMRGEEKRGEENSDEDSGLEGRRERGGGGYIRSVVWKTEFFVFLRLSCLSCLPSVVFSRFPRLSLLRRSFRRLRRRFSRLPSCRRRELCSDRRGHSLHLGCCFVLRLVAVPLVAGRRRSMKKGIFSCGKLKSSCQTLKHTACFMFPYYFQFSIPKHVDHFFCMF